MGLAFEVASAVSEGVNQLCALLAWNDAGACGDPPVDDATLAKTMAAVEEAMRELVHGGRISGVAPSITEEDIERMTHLRSSIADRTPTGALSPEVVTLAERWIALWGGVSWRDLMAAARR